MEKKSNEFKMNGTWTQAMKGTEMKAMFQEVLVEHLELELRVQSLTLQTEQNNRLVLSKS